MKLVLVSDAGAEEIVTSFRLEGEKIVVNGGELSASIPLDQDAANGDCDNTGHRWSRWVSHLVSNTDYRDGLYHTTKTPWQARLCLDCGFSERQKV